MPNCHNYTVNQYNCPMSKLITFVAVVVTCQQYWNRIIISSWCGRMGGVRNLAALLANDYVSMWFSMCAASVKTNINYNFVIFSHCKIVTKWTSLISYHSWWIYNYLNVCNQCLVLSPLKLWVRTPIQNSVIKFDCDLRQVCGFPQVLRFPPPLKLTATK